MKETEAQTPKTPADPAAGSPPGSRPIRRRTPSSSSSASSFSSTSPTPSPSPAHRIFYPLRSSSTIPFSWEHLPGVPKSLPTASHAAADPRRRLLLPLPPPLRSKSIPSMPRRKRSNARFANLATDDPFAAALAECAKDDPPGTELDKLCREPAAGSRRRWSAVPAIADRFGLLDLYGSCKTSCSVAEVTISVPRSIAHRAAEYGRLNRRSTS